VFSDTLGNLDKVERITRLLAAKESPDQGVSRIAEHQWILDALAVLLEAERERLLAGSTSLLSQK
jgi:hypothetical protein